MRNSDRLLESKSRLAITEALTPNRSIANENL
jgi:hypothetical protein